MLKYTFKLRYNMKIGIYCIIFDGCNQVYIGQSIRMESRWHDHLYALKHNKCSNYKLSKAYSLYGEPSFNLLEECEVLELDSKEEDWIKEFNSYTDGLNLVPGSISARGLDSGNSTITKDSLLNVLDLLIQVPLFTIEQISTIAGISPSRVSDIQKGTTHVWLKEEYPNKYSTMLNLKGDRFANRLTILSNKVDTVPIVVDRGGKEYVVSNVSEFSRTHGVDIGNFCKMLYGTVKYKCVKGFSLKDRAKHLTKAPKSYPNLFSPDGVEYGVSNMAQFARDHGLSESGVGKLIRGAVKTHKGWKLNNS